MSPHLLTHRNEQRGASEVVGIVLLFGLVLVGATFVFVTGSSTLDSIQNEAQLESAEQSIETLNTELKSVSAKRANATTDLQLRSTEVADVTTRHDTTIRIEATYDEGAPKTTAVDVGSIVYTHSDGTKLVSQAGAVWRVGDSGTTTVTPPALEYRNGTFVFDIVNTTGPIDPVDGTVRASRNAATSNATTGQVYAELIVDADGDGAKELPATITFRVDGPNTDAWQQYFKSEFVDDSRVTEVSGGARFDLISSVEGGTSTGTNADSVTEFAGRPSTHVFQYTVEGGLDGTLSQIEVAYDGTPDLRSFDRDDIQSIGVDTDGDGFLDTTGGLDAVETVDVTGSRVTIALDTDAGPDSLPVAEDDTIMLRYGALEPGSVTNPAENADGVRLRFVDDQGNDKSVDADLGLRPDLEPITADGEELLVNARNVTVDNVNTAFEANATDEGGEVAADVVIVSDQSGSMNTNDPTGLRPDAANAFIDTLEQRPTNDQVATVHFSANCFADSHDSKKIERLQQIDFNDVEAIAQDRDARSTCNTNYHAGLQTALDILDDREPEAKETNNSAIVFMGDGGHNADRVEYDSVDEYEFDEFPDEANIRGLADEADQRNITIHTIGFSEGIDDSARALLNQMADRTGGTTQFPEQASDLEATFEEVAENIGPDYRVDHEPVSLTARINDGQYTIDAGGAVFQQGPGSSSTNRPLFDPRTPFDANRVPTVEIPSDREIRNGEPLRLTIAFNEHGCAADGGLTDTGEVAVGEDGTEYARRLCSPIDADDPVRTSGPGDVNYHVLTTGDTAPSVDTAEWQTPLVTALEDAGYASGGSLDLDDSEAVVVVEPPADGPDVNIEPQGYAAYAVRANDAVEPNPTAEILEPGNRRLFGISVQAVELDE